MAETTQLVNLSVKISNKQPIELVDLTRGLLSLADEYKRYTASNPEPLADHDVRLYVKEVRSGSVEAFLQAGAPIALLAMENANTVIAFAAYLKTAYNYLVGAENDKPALEKANYENLSNIIEPVVKDNGSSIAITVNNNTAPVVIFMDSTKAKAAQNTIRRELDALKEPTTGIKEKVLLYWYQARNDPKSKTGDKAIIESLHNGPVKTIFMTDSIKGKILSSAENPFTMAYIVDVSVETIGGKPSLYRIIDMHESFERE